MRPYKKMEGQVLWSFVSMMHSQTRGEKTGSQGRFAIKGFSDLTVRFHTTQHAGQVLACRCSLTNQVLPMAFRLNDSYITFYAFFIQVIWCDTSPLSLQLEDKKAFNKCTDWQVLWWCVELTEMQDPHDPQWLWIVKLRHKRKQFYTIRSTREWFCKS